MKQILKQHKFTNDEIELAAEFVSQIDVYDFDTVTNYSAKTIATINENLKFIYELLHKANNDANINYINDFMQNDINNYHLVLPTGTFSFMQSKSKKCDMVKKSAHEINGAISDIFSKTSLIEQILNKQLSAINKIYAKMHLFLKEVSVFCYAAISKYQFVIDNELPILVEKARESGLHRHALDANDLKTACEFFYRITSDLLLIRDHAQFTLKQYTAIGENASLLAKACNKLVTDERNAYIACHDSIANITKSNYNQLPCLQTNFNTCINDVHDSLLLISTHYNSMYKALKLAETSMNNAKKEISELKSNK